MEEIGKILPAVFKRRGRQGEQGILGILASLWPRVVGKPIALHSRPVAFGAGMLTLATNCPSWAVQLRYLAEEIRAEINSFLREPVVENLRVVRHATLEPLTPASQGVVLNPDLKAGKFNAVGSRTDLGPETARMVERSFTRYLTRNGKRFN